jgi:hypothetical protein
MLQYMKCVLQDNEVKLCLVQMGFANGLVSFWLWLGREGDQEAQDARIYSGFLGVS